MAGTGDVAWTGWSDLNEQLGPFVVVVVVVVVAVVVVVVVADDVFTAPWNSHVFATHVECPNVM